MKTSGGFGPDPRASKGLKIGLTMTEEIEEKDEEFETARKEVFTHRGREITASTEITVKKNIEEEKTDHPMKLLIFYLIKVENMQR